MLHKRPCKCKRCHERKIRNRFFGHLLKACFLLLQALWVKRKKSQRGGGITRQIVSIRMNEEEKNAKENSLRVVRRKI